ncbi:MAG: hypothetical protein ACXWG7_04820 [Chthoniobacterales bacterium]
MRARPREINIFNMSLLDILCGALGAFCFMMLVALPYYVVGSIDRAEREKRTEELFKDLDKLRQSMSDPAQAEDLRKLVEELEAQIKQLQGELNQAEHEIDQLRDENTRLTSENNSLTAENNKLRSDNSRLTTENNQLQDKNDKLTAENTQLKAQHDKDQARIEASKPFLVMAGGTDSTQDLAIFVEDVSVGFEKDKSKLVNSKFDPRALRQASGWQNDLTDIWVTERAVTLWISGTTSATSRYRVFVKYRRPPSEAEQNLPFSNSYLRRTDVHVTFRGDWADDKQSALVTLTPERFWVFVGMLNVDEKAQLTFKEASEEERNSVWREFMKTEPPSVTPTPAPTITPSPGLSEEDMKRLREMALQRQKALEEEKARREQQRGISPAPSASPSGTINEQERLRRERILREREHNQAPSPSATP